MFECKEQEVHDLNTGVTLVFGRHAGFEGKGTAWVRVVVRSGDPLYTKITTIIFDSKGDVMRMTEHKPDVVNPFVDERPTAVEGPPAEELPAEEPEVPWVPEPPLHPKKGHGKR